MTATRRGVILPAVLAVLLLVGLLAARFALRVGADVAAMRSEALKFQTRLAAEAGIERVKLMLRDDRYDVNRWYDNVRELHRLIVWARGADETLLGSNDELDKAEMAYRCSLVADDPTDDEERVRFGITDESAKLNLNVATERQLLILMEQVLPQDAQVSPVELVNAILDWRDSDTVPRGEEGDTEGEYYRSLEKPYLVKNGPFESVEELLLVKGITPRILYGEDVDRNGLLSPNEDDGDETFPPDDRDGRLNRGLYAYLTVYSTENDVSNDLRPRVNLLATAEEVRAGLEGDFPDEPEVVDFIIASTRVEAGARQRGYTPGAGISRQGRYGNRESGNSGGGRTQDDSTENQGTEDPKEQQRRQARDPVSGEEQTGETPSDNTGEPDTGGEDGEGQEGVDGEGEGTGDESDDALGVSEPIRSPASLLRDRAGRGEIMRSPLEPRHLPILMDRCTVRRPEESPIRGLININTAPVPVLRCLEGLTEEQAQAIIAKRGVLSSETKSTTAWLVTEEVLDIDTFNEIASKITARGMQFRIDSIGYADHVGGVTRLEVVVDVIGPMAQTVYYRDITHVGVSFPLRQSVGELMASGR